MNTFLNYLIEANLGLIFFYGIYWLVLQKEDQFTFKRTYLLSSVVASLVFPFFTIGVSTSLIPSLSQTTAVQWLPEIVIYANGNVKPEANSFFLNWSWITYAYLIIAAVALILFLIRIFSLITLFKQSAHYTWKNYTVAESDKVQGVFSFFHFIFLSPGDLLAETEKQEILRHEEVHIKKLHSIDIILIQLLGIVFWFNPIVRSYKKSFVQIHEFEADARSVEGHDVDEYCSLLAKVALQNNGYILANHFTNSFTLKRIMMMKTVKRKIKNWKVVAAAFTLPLFFFVVACQDQIVNELQGSTISQVSEYPEEVKADLVKLEKKYPGTKFTYVEGSADEVRKIFMDHPDQQHMIMNSYDFPERKITGVLTVDISKYDLKDENEIFTIVEETAQPKNGINEFYANLATQIKYPEQARKTGVEGRVFVEFVVNKDGSLSEVKVLRGIGAGCDSEAMRVVSKSENWNPARQRGKAVKQRIVLPIVFALGKSPDYGSIYFEEPVEGEKQSMKVNGSFVQENGKNYMIGQVFDSNGNPLPGMNIVLAGTTQGTVSDLEGKYRLAVTNKTGKLVFSFVGFENESLSF
jgi:TonB family protein